MNSKNDEKKNRISLKQEHGTPLTQLYSDIKSGLDKGPSGVPTMRVSGGMMRDADHPGAIAWRQKASAEADKLACDCHRHMLVDIYCKIIPLDNDYVQGHHGQLAGDVDNMLSSKGMTATQYLTSCYEATKAPLLEFLLRSGNMIGQQFKEDANETLKDAQEKDIEVPAPEAPTTDDEEIQSQLVDVKSDSEYSTFIDQLKQKTIKKIVSDVSKIISNKKDEKSMTFDTTPIADQEAQTESTTSIAVNYVQQHLIKESVELDNDGQDMVIGMAIRESTLNEINRCFKQPDSNFRSYSSRVRIGHGYVVTESAVKTFIEEVGSPKSDDSSSKKEASDKELADSIDKWKEEGNKRADDVKKSLLGDKKDSK